jgi:hypothetical protein
LLQRSLFDGGFEPFRDLVAHQEGMPGRNRMEASSPELFGLWRRCGNHGAF